VAPVTCICEVTFQRIAISSIQRQFGELSPLIGFILQTSGIQPEVESALRKLLAKKMLWRRSNAGCRNCARSCAHQPGAGSNPREHEDFKGHVRGKSLTPAYVASLNQPEDRLAKINSEISAKEVELTGRQREYLTTAELITFDQTR